MESRPTSMDTRGAFSGVVDVLENITGVDFDGDGKKGQGRGLVDGIEAVTGMDIDGDGIKGVGLLNTLEDATGLDLDGDGTVNGALYDAEHIKKERERARIQGLSKSANSSFIRRLIPPLHASRAECFLPGKRSLMCKVWARQACEMKSTA